MDLTGPPWLGFWGFRASLKICKESMEKDGILGQGDDELKDVFGVKHGGFNIIFEWKEL